MYNKLQIYTKSSNYTRCTNFKGNKTLMNHFYRHLAYIVTNIPKIYLTIFTPCGKNLIFFAFLRRKKRTFAA